jgi:hypothetical protein
MYAIVSVDKYHKHAYDVEDNGTIVRAACLHEGTGECATNLQTPGRKFGGTGQLRVKWTNSPSKQIHNALYPENRW